MHFYSLYIIFNLSLNYFWLKISKGVWSMDGWRKPLFFYGEGRRVLDFFDTVHKRSNHREVGISFPGKKKENTKEIINFCISCSMYIILNLSLSHVSFPKFCKISGASNLSRRIREWWRVIKREKGKPRTEILFLFQSYFVYRIFRNGGK